MQGEAGSATVRPGGVGVLLCGQRLGKGALLQAELPLLKSHTQMALNALDER